MIYPFNAWDAFKIAVNMEENGLKFYKAAAKKFSGPIADLFNSLAQEEEIHKSIFTRFLNGLPKEQTTLYDPDNETDDYLKMMADIHVFKNDPENIDKLMEGVATVEDALKLAMSFEKDSIVFFVQLKNASDNLSDEVSVDRLILEEAKHLRKLSRIFNNQKSK
ncbi:MAG: ferritin family protein [Deltaproteobacteria bacterium]|jgi:rubrerythrin|nr:ferritin family protein [Deltaproteobacteria bacterium]